MFTPQPLPEHYVWLGRVMSACSMLEVQIGMIGWAWVNGQPWTEDWSKVAGSPGAAVKGCEKAAKAMPPELAAEVAALLTASEPIREERNKFAHAVFVLDPTRAADDQWLLKSARIPDFSPLTEAVGTDLVQQANSLSRLAKTLSGRAADESPHSRTAAAP